MTLATSLMTAGRIIRLAYKDAGLIQEGDSLEGEQVADGLMRLNDLANLWQTQGIKLWLQYDQPVTLTAGKVMYSFKPGGDVDLAKPLRGLQAYYSDSNGIHRPLVVLSREEYMRLSQTAQTGAVNSYFIDKQRLEMDMYLWPVPDATAATGTVHVLIQQQVTGVSALTDTVGFPLEWGMALRWGLADELATGQPQPIMARCTQRSEHFRELLDDWDVEDAPTMFAPDQRTGYGYSRFR